MRHAILAAAAAAILCSGTTAGAAAHLKLGTYVTDDDFQEEVYLLGHDGLGLCYDLVSLEEPITLADGTQLIMYRNSMPMKWKERSGKIVIECKNGKQIIRESYTIKSSKAFGEFVLHPE